MNQYRGKHAPSQPWPVASTARVATRRGRHLMKNRRRRFWGFLIAFVLLALILWPFAEARILRTETRTLVMEDFPYDAGSLRVVFCSDIHWGYWFSDSDLSHLISRINSLRPDLVLFGGDYATDHESAIRFFRKLSSSSMERMHSRYGVYGVLGETDWGKSVEDRKLLAEAMANADVTPLINQVVPIYIEKSRIFLAGLDDVSVGKPDLKSLAAGVSASDFVIFLAHNPSIIPSAQQALDSTGSLGWFDLGLFGHTHGGQMKFFTRQLNIAPDVPDRYLSGWKTENRGNLLISNGVGTSVFPGRLFCPPQVHLIEIVSN